MEMIGLWQPLVDRRMYNRSSTRMDCSRMINSFFTFEFTLEALHVIFASLLPNTCLFGRLGSFTRLCYGRMFWSPVDIRVYMYSFVDFTALMASILLLGGVPGWTICQMLQNEIVG